jgi:MFS family permease
MNSFLKINSSEAYVFKLHLLFSVLQGVLVGVFALNEFVYIKDLKATDIQLSFLLQAASLVFLSSVFLNEVLRRITNKQKMLRWASVLAHLPLFSIAFFPADSSYYTQYNIFTYLFLSIFFVFYLNTVIILPTINQMLKNNYSHNNFSRLYGYSSTINKVVIMFSTIAFGFLLDFDNYSFIYVYPIMGVLGILSVFLLSNIKYIDAAQPKNTYWKSTVYNIVNSIHILKINKPYLHFEFGFMFYGFAWMIATAVIPIYFNEVFQMNHATYGFYKNGYNLLAIMVLPFFGNLLGKIDPRKFGVYTFGSLLLFVVFIMLSNYFPQSFKIGEITIYFTLIVAYLFYGIFAATMALLWFIGSAYFCKSEEASQYQSIHLTLTGLRSIFSFQIGVLLYQSQGFNFTFSIAALSLLLSVIIMFWSYRRSLLVV